MGKLDMLRQLSGLMPQRAQSSEGIANRAAVAERQRQAFVRTTASNYVNLMNSAETTAHAEVYQRQLGQIVNHLSPQDQKMMQPLLAGTPLGIAERRDALFKKYHGERPTTVGLNQKENATAYAERIFAGAKWDSARAKMVTGVDKEVPRVIGLSDNQAAVMRKDGVASIMTADQVTGEGIASIYGMPFGEWVANGGIRNGDWETVFRNGQEIKYRTRYDTVNQRVLKPEETITTAQAAASRSQIASDKKFGLKQLELFSEFNNKTGDVWESYKRLVLEQGQSSDSFVRDYFQPAFPGRVIKIFGVKDTFLGGKLGTDVQSVGKDYRIVARRGILARHPNPKKKSFIFDPLTGKAYDSGTFAEIAPPTYKPKFTKEEIAKVLTKPVRKSWAEMTEIERTAALHEEFEELFAGIGAGVEWTMDLLAYTAKDWLGYNLLRETLNAFADTWNAPNKDLTEEFYRQEGINPAYVPPPNEGRKVERRILPADRTTRRF